MDLRQLRYFVAVAEELHFTRAARRVHVAQPTLSHQVGLLEKELGVTLLTRSKRHVELTHAGRIFLNEAQRLLRSADDAVQAAQSAQAGRLGQLMVVCGPTAAYVGLLGMLELYRRGSPQVDLHLIESPVVDAVVTVEQGSADVGLDGRWMAHADTTGFYRIREVRSGWHLITVRAIGLMLEMLANASGAVSCGTTPADWIILQNSRALPSPMGGSFASNSMIALSTP